MRSDRPGTRSAARGLLVALVTLASAGTVLPAQERVHGAVKRPTIGGHMFLSSDNVPDPFVRSYVRQSLGIAQAADLRFPLEIVAGDTLALLDGTLTNAVLDVEYQHAVKDWLAARGRFSLRGRLGTDGASLLQSGVQVNTGFEFGWLIRLLQKDRILLSASADVSNNSFTAVDIDQFVRDIVARVPDPQLADHIPAVRGTGGLRFAWGVSRLFGLTALAEAGYGDAPRRDEAGDFLYATGVALDFDLGAVTPVPIGIGLSYSQTSVLQQTDADSDQRTVVLRLGYSGRPDFVIGLDIATSTARDLNVDGTVTAVGAALTMRYYF